MPHTRATSSSDRAAGDGRLPFDDSRFDAVACIHVLQHVADTQLPPVGDAAGAAPGRALAVAVPYHGRVYRTVASLGCIRAPSRPARAGDAVLHAPLAGRRCSTQFGYGAAGARCGRWAACRSSGARSGEGAAARARLRRGALLGDLLSRAARRRSRCGSAARTGRGRSRRAAPASPGGLGEAVQVVLAEAAPGLGAGRLSLDRLLERCARRRPVARRVLDQRPDRSRDRPTAGRGPGRVGGRGAAREVARSAPAAARRCPCGSERHGCATTATDGGRRTRRRAAGDGKRRRRRARPSGRPGDRRASAAPGGSSEARLRGRGDGPRPATHPAANSPVIATAGTNQVQSRAECTPNTTATSASAASPVRSGGHSRSAPRPQAERARRPRTARRPSATRLTRGRSGRGRRASGGRIRGRACPARAGRGSCSCAWANEPAPGAGDLVRRSQTSIARAQ